MAAFGDLDDDFEVDRESKVPDSELWKAQRNFRHAVAWEEMNAKKRCTMEDVHRIVPSMQGAEEYSYFGVYDGHGGRQIVDFLEERLENNISKELQEPDDAPILERLRRAYLITDMQSRQADIMTSGATVVGLLLLTRFAVEDSKKVTERKIYVGNSGDSRAVLYYKKQDGEAGDDSPAGKQQRVDAQRAMNERRQFGGPVDSSDSSDSEDLPPFCGLTAQRLTYDHRIDDDGEQDRIKKAGGFFTRNRVLGILAVTRSFGDHSMKEFVCADPHLKEVDLLSKTEPQLLILACDGVWDVLTDQEAGDIVMEEYSRIGGPYNDASRLLVNRAIERGSADNVTAVVVFL